MSIPKPPSPTPTKVNSGRVRNYRVTAEELINFMNREGLEATELASILGVTYQAVGYWMKGEREMTLTVSRLIRLFDRYPHLLREF